MRIMAIVVIYSMLYNWESDQVDLDGGNQDESDDSGHE